MKKYELTDFDFNLPEALIAQAPLNERRSSRLLCVDVQRELIRHQQFENLLDFVTAGDVIIFNDTKVIPARLRGYKSTGGKVECLVERILTEKTALIQIRSSKSPRVNSQLYLANEAITVQVISRERDLFLVEFLGDDSVIEQLKRYGDIPLPPYIKRAAEAVDLERYQTVYAQNLGAVAAPTAGLHFDELILQQLQQKGVNLQKITLHVGAGTFQPLRYLSLDAHEMHAEYFKIEDTVCKAIRQAQEARRRVIAVGTTVVRCLESAALSGDLLAQTGETRLFIRPGFQFKVIDTLLTNFHLPKSSLLILVSAFAGYNLTLECYRQAVQQSYRFFSYGDAMLISK